MTANASDSEIDSVIKDWLRFAKDRDGSISVCYIIPWYQIKAVFKNISSEATSINETKQYMQIKIYITLYICEQRKLNINVDIYKLLQKP